MSLIPCSCQQYLDCMSFDLSLKAFRFLPSRKLNISKCLTRLWMKNLHKNQLGPMRISSVGIVIFHGAFGNSSRGNARGWLQFKKINGPTSKLARLENFRLSFKLRRLQSVFSFPSLIILVPLWFIIISLVFFYLSKLLFLQVPLL